MFGSESDELGLLLKMDLCLSIKVENNDGNSKHICIACMSKLEMFYEFRQLALTSRNLHLLQYKNELLIDNAVDATSMAEVSRYFIRLFPAFSISSW